MKTLVLLLAITATVQAQTYRKVCNNGRCYYVLEQPAKISDEVCQDGYCFRRKDGVIEVKWGNIWYSRTGCTSPYCTMDNHLREGFKRGRDYFKTLDAKQLTPETQPLGEETIADALKALTLTPEDVFADLGCGDGRILIEAVKRYGCRAFGVEIDQKQAQRAHNAVKAAGLQDKIVILRQDAANFRPKAYGITAATAYLFPETLAKLTRTIQDIPRVVVPFHAVPDLTPSRKEGDLFIYGEAVAVPPASPTPQRPFLSFEVVGL